MEKKHSLARSSFDGAETTDDGMPIALQGRNLHTQQVSFFRTRIKHTDRGLTTQVGILPRDAFIKSISVYTLSDFNGATAKFGKKPHDSDYGTATLATSGVEELDLPLTVRNVPLEFENTIYVTRDKTSTQGEAEVIVEFYTNR
ncbi:hypothetical protein [Bartonella sp. AR 15-3]|uniref:hypothetical protein n=1 Tax=Bartonella sp. AR 15-3 TaxID=545617 RepID=UPI0001F4C24A|nr:hypothetical protein [Bartonella sp. AR 15-3]OPB31562.1 hypothetical protein BAR153v2_005110 [Bartonella sp. AR 15-3]CBI79420.1 conserved hypothetical protein [Bartonella sp. AR 15-3]